MKLKELYAQIIKESVEDLIKTFIGFQTYEEFETYIKSLSNEDKTQVLNYITNLNKTGTCSSGTTLYHGTTDKIASDIRANGFKIGKGMRSGFMGADSVVDNKGVFLTNSDKMADFFGNNRSSGSGKYSVLMVCAKIQNTLDLTIPAKMPIELKKIGLELVNDYNGSTKTAIANKDIWWLLDKGSFVDEIKSLGYDSVKFKESSSVVKMTGDQSAFTYMVFDVNKLSPTKKINTLQDFFAYIKE